MLVNQASPICRRLGWCLTLTKSLLQKDFVLDVGRTTQVCVVRPFLLWVRELVNLPADWGNA